MTKNIEPIYIDHKARGNQLTAEEFNKIPEKVNELVKAQNTEEERIKQVVAKNRPTLGQLQNVSDEVDSLTSETCVLVWNGDAWVSMKLSELGIGQGGGQQQSILYYLRANNQSASTTLSASKSAGECPSSSCSSRGRKTWVRRSIRTRVNGAHTRYSPRLEMVLSFQRHVGVASLTP